MSGNKLNFLTHCNLDTIRIPFHGNHRKACSRWASRRWLLAAVLSVAGPLSAAPLVASDTYEQEPISYSSPVVHDPITRLQDRLNRGEAKLPFDDRTGYLRAVLRELDIPISSQLLVFSKTSFQRDRIGPETPRALYFNDDTYIGWVQLGEVLEVSTVDPQKGAIFYTLPQSPREIPKFRRHIHECLQCHDSSLSQGVPGHFVRSVYPDGRGLPILTAGTFVTNHQSPLKERWGGWYVTGTHDQQVHMGNMVVRRETLKDQPERIDLVPTGNRRSLEGLCDTSAYLSTHSDIVALMVFEHQTHLHNLLTKASFQTRLALRDEVALNKALGHEPGERLESTTSRIKSVGEPLVRYLLFADEAPLAGKITGTSGFADEFSRRGPHDSRGRSLREFDLERRMFRYPLSYLIYSDAFAELPRDMRDYVYRRLWQILCGDDTTGKFAHLSAADRQAIVEIVRDTQRDLPSFWVGR